jgi:mannose-6-phosphate isomerase-like protein (cupin superfamily)
MLVKRVGTSPEIIANDGCHLRELLHPARDGSGVSYSLALAWVAVGEKTHPHKLLQTEVYLIIRGKGRMHIGDEMSEVQPGDAVVIPPQQVQWIENIGRSELEFAAIVSPPWKAEDDVRVDVGNPN